MTTEGPAPRPSLRVPGMRAALRVEVGVALAAAAAALLLGGRAELYGVAAGVVLVVGFFSFGTLATSVVAALAPRISLGVAMLTYTLQVALLALVLVLLDRLDPAATTIDLRWLAGTVIVGTLCWTGALVVDAVHGGHAPTSTGEVRG